MFRLCSLTAAGCMEREVREERTPKLGRMIPGMML